MGYLNPILFLLLLLCLLLSNILQCYPRSYTLRWPYFPSTSVFHIATLSFVSIELPKSCSSSAQDLAVSHPFTVTVYETRSIPQELYSKWTFSIFSTSCGLTRYHGRIHRYFTAKGQQTGRKGGPIHQEQADHGGVTESQTSSKLKAGKEL